MLKASWFDRKYRVLHIHIIQSLACVVADKRETLKLIFYPYVLNLALLRVNQKEFLNYKIHIVSYIYRYAHE
jgi:hypothetical protein